MCTRGCDRRCPGHDRTLHAQCGPAYPGPNSAWPAPHARLGTHPGPWKARRYAPLQCTPSLSSVATTQARRLLGSVVWRPLVAPRAVSPPLPPPQDGHSSAHCTTALHPQGAASALRPGS
eukprot:scaffold115179_cov39-Phaeocystis_antarctica.AAC.2